MPYKSSVAVFVLDIFIGSETAPVALVKKHPDGFLWHTADKWELGKKGTHKRHRSPVFETAREAVGNCLVWLEKNGIAPKGARVEPHDVRFEPGRTRTSGSLTEDVLAKADALLAHVPKSVLGERPKPAPREASAATGSGSDPTPTKTPARQAPTRPVSQVSRRVPPKVSGYTPMTGHDRAAR